MIPYNFVSSPAVPSFNASFLMTQALIVPLCARLHFELNKPHGYPRGILNWLTQKNVLTGYFQLILPTVYFISFH